MLLARSSEQETSSKRASSSSSSNQNAILGRLEEVLQGPHGLGHGHEAVGGAGPDVGLDAEVEGRELCLFVVVLGPLARGDDDVDWFARVLTRFVPVQSPSLLGREAEDDESVHGVVRGALVDEGAEGGVAHGETGVVGD